MDPLQTKSHIFVTKNIRSWSQNPGSGSIKLFLLGGLSWFWVHKIIFTGGLPPPRPLALPGGLPAPQTPWRGACSPVPPCIPRGSASRGLRFFLVPRSWKPLTCGYVAAGAFLFSRKMVPIFLEPPNLCVGGLIKN